MYNLKIDRIKFALLAMQRYSWEQGITMQAFLEQGDIDLVAQLARGAVHRQLEDGRVAKTDVSDVSVDPLTNIEGIIAAIKYTGDEELKKGLERLLDYALRGAPRNENGIMYFFKDNTEFWSEGMYMLHPSLAAAGYYKEAFQSFHAYWDALFDKEKNLISHRWDDLKKSFVRKAPWGVGNGWTVSGLAKMYDLLPEEYAAEKSDISAKAKTLIDSILTYLRPDNLLHDVIDDPSTFVETNCPQMLAYAIYRGLMSGWLDNSYLSAAEKIREAVTAKIDDFGIVRGVCGAPSFDHYGVAPEGQAFCLMLDAAAKKYYGNCRLGL
jgi:rhamnogalacturonyl hydrolase YesR